MKAVYESNQSFYQLSYGEVNRYTPVMGVSFDDAKRKYKDNYHQVGYAIKEPSQKNRLEFYQFCKGENHNQLILTDPREIRNMRDYIERRHDNFITEVSFEGNEADLEDPVESILEATEEKPKKYEEGLQYEELSAWDREMVSRMSK